MPIRALALAALIAAEGAADIIDRIAVSVANHVITTSDLDRQIRITAFINGTKPDFSPAGKRAMAAKMVEQTLVKHELETSRYPEPSPSEVEPLLAQFKAERFNSPAEYTEALADYGITEQELRNEFLWQRTLLTFLDVRFRPGVQLSDEDIQTYFDKVVKPAAEGAHPGQTPSLDDYRDQIEETLIGQREDEEMTRWLDEARRRSQIIYHDEAFQ